MLPNCVIFSDADNHALIIHGIREGKLEKHIFRHNDVKHLRNLPSQYSYDTPKLVIFESVHSMRGTVAPFLEIIQLSKEFNAMTYCDEVHAVGMYGSEGQGMASVHKCEGEIDIIQGTLGKAFCAFCGYIAGKAEVIDAVRGIPPGFIFTTTLPPCITAASLASIRHLRRSSIERENHQNVVKMSKSALKAAEIDCMQSDTHIIPVLIGNPAICREISIRFMNEFDIYVQSINFPTVPLGRERLRITPTLFHTQKMIDDLVKALNVVLK